MPQFLAKYDSISTAISKADFVRFAYMYVWGGVYADLDVECVNKLDVLLGKFSEAGKFAQLTFTAILSTLSPGVVLGMMGIRAQFDHLVPNAFLASRPRHPLWLHCMQMSGEDRQGRIENVSLSKFVVACLLQCGDIVADCCCCRIKQDCRSSTFESMRRKLHWFSYQWSLAIKDSIL